MSSLCVLTIYAFGTKALKNNDCSDAYNICALTDYHFPDMAPGYEMDNVALEQSNFKETNSLWMKLTARRAGVLDFVIVPDNDKDDIDFVLYEAKEQSCNSKLPIRVMTSGITYGKLRSSSTCLGQTGLQYFSSDMEEKDGCNSIDDNFLKPVQLEEDQSYYLLVNNYDSNSGFTILFNGDGILELEDYCNNDIEEVSFYLYPNPTVDEINISSSIVLDVMTHVKIYDNIGRLVRSNVVKSFTDLHTFDISGLPSGKYMVHIQYHDEISLKSFVKS